MNPSANPDPLSQLRDIHLPAEISWWPPAPGWWLLMILMILAALALLVAFVQHRRRTAYRRVAQRLLCQVPLRSCTAAEQLRDINRILKRTALTAYPQQDIATLHGESWYSFLCQTAPGAHPHSDLQAVFAVKLYDGADPDPAELDAVTRFARTWVSSHRAAHRSLGGPAPC